ncbi:hypothetical protein EB093_04620 [bacterium]|nr:hypothetical protein [bacterium]
MSIMQVICGDPNAMGHPCIDSLTPIPELPTVVIDVRLASHRVAEVIGNASWAITRTPSIERIIFASPDHDDLTPYLDYLS